VLINLIVILIIIFLLFILSMVWPPDSPWSPWWRTDKKLARTICKLGKISSKDVIYDLGCGDGVLITTAAKEFGAKCVGIEIDPIRFLISNLRVRLNRLSSKVILKRKNFHNEDLSKASVVTVYLVPRVLKLIKQKLIRELKPEARIISFTYKMSLPLVKQDRKNKLYLYRIPKKQNT
jgi:predicted RNA methylase